MTGTSVVVCGAARSGTSMLANLLADGGLTTADELIAPSQANPHGFGEDIRVNRLNDRLLETLPRRGRSEHLPRRLWWLGAYGRSSAPDDARRIAAAPDLVPRPPFVLKDPRFSYTFPAWRGVLGPVVTLVVVRSPGEVATSLARMARGQPEFFGDHCRDDDDVRSIVGPMWTAAHRSILSWADETTYFIEPIDVTDRLLLDALAHRLGRSLSARTVDGELGTSEPMTDVPVDSDIARHVRRRLVLDRRRLLEPFGSADHADRRPAGSIAI